MGHSLELCASAEQGIAQFDRTISRSVDPDPLEQIFRPFFTTKDKGQGTGLGLAIVQTIIKRDNGTIRATSEKGKRTCFHLTLPTFLKN